MPLVDDVRGGNAPHALAGTHPFRGGAPGYPGFNRLRRRNKTDSNGSPLGALVFEASIATFATSCSIGWTALASGPSTPSTRGGGAAAGDGIEPQTPRDVPRSFQGFLCPARHLQ